VVATSALALAGVLLWVAQARYGGPVRIVEVAPQVLIAGQLPADEWRTELERFAVRSVINLRGPRPGQRWYADEIVACRELGVGHEDVRIKLDDWPPQHEVRRFVSLLGTLPRPLLLHCKDGYDRSGWGAAIVLLLEGSSLDDALACLSPTAGHVCRRDVCPLHRFFAEYEAWLADSGATHGPDVFRSWALERYCPPPYDAAIEVVDAPARRARAADMVSLLVRVANRSRERWTLSADPEHGIRLGARCIGPYTALPEDAVAVFRTPNGPARDLARAGLEDGVIEPGGERAFELRFRVPSAPGTYAVQVDMVDEHVHWFSDLGGPGVVLALEVTPR